jgi:DNA-binding MarR family transcriptional regulator
MAYSEKNPRPSSSFVGFKRNYLERFFPYPNILEEHWHEISGSEQKVLDFIMRQTTGFRKRYDYIAYSQFVHGIGERNKGTGLKLSAVKRAVDGLEKKGFIEVLRFKNRASRFGLVYEHGQYEDYDSVKLMKGLQALLH